MNKIIYLIAIISLFLSCDMESENQNEITLVIKNIPSTISSTSEWDTSSIILRNTTSGNVNIIQGGTYSANYTIYTKTMSLSGNYEVFFTANMSKADSLIAGLGKYTFDGESDAGFIIEPSMVKKVSDFGPAVMGMNFSAWTGSDYSGKKMMFSESMNPDSVENAFTITSDSSGVEQYFTLSWNSDFTEATINTVLMPKKMYTATLKQNATNTEGTRLFYDDYTYNFDIL